MKGRRLTVDELMKMDGQKVWVKDLNPHNGGDFSGICTVVTKKRELLGGNGDWTLEHGGIEVYEYIEEPRTYKTSEMIAMLEDNPKLKFRCLSAQGVEFENVSVVNGTVCWNGNEYYALQVSVNRLTWTLVEEPKEVDFMTAVKAYDKGKKVFCKLDGAVSLKLNKHFYLEGERAVSVDEVLLGKWYIGEPS